MSHILKKILCLFFQEEKANYDKICEEAFADAKSEKRVLLNRDWLDSPWKGVIFCFNCACPLEVKRFILLHQACLSLQGVQDFKKILLVQSLCQKETAPVKRVRVYHNFI